MSPSDGKLYSQTVCEPMTALQRWLPSWRLNSGDDDQRINKRPCCPPPRGSTTVNGKRAQVVGIQLAGRQLPRNAVRIEVEITRSGSTVATAWAMDTAPIRPL